MSIVPLDTFCPALGALEQSITTLFLDDTVTSFECPRLSPALFGPVGSVLADAIAATLLGSSSRILCSVPSSSDAGCVPEKTLTRLRLDWLDIGDECTVGSGRPAS
jgi:hypothetical protein